MAEIIEVDQVEDFFGMDWYDPTCYAVEILDAKYEKVEVDEVITQRSHLNPQQKKKTLKRYSRDTPSSLMELWGVSTPTKNLH
jgi:hypothetical protein